MNEEIDQADEDEVIDDPFEQPEEQFAMSGQWLTGTGQVPKDDLVRQRSAPDQ